MGDKKIKIALINVIPSKNPVLVRPLGIETVAGYIRDSFKDNCEVVLYDMQFQTKEEVAELIKSQRPHILGFSVKVRADEEIQYIIENTKTSEDSPLIVFGNVVATFAHNYLLKKHPSSIVVIGEGELAIGGIITNLLKEKSDFSEVPNLAFIRNSQIIETPREALELENMSLPAFDVAGKIQENGGHTWLESSRGCNGVCTFCCRRPVRNTWWKQIPTQRILGEMRALIQKGVRHFRFTDELFMGTNLKKNSAENRKQRIELAEGMISLAKEFDTRISFDISDRADTVYSETDTPEEAQEKIAALKKLKEAGLAQIYLGFESASPRQLKRYAKMVTKDENSKAIDILRSLNIQTVLGFIPIDYLMEDPNEIKENIAFLREKNIVSPDNQNVFVTESICFLRAFAGSSYVRLLQQKGLLSPNRRESLVDYDAKYLNPKIGLIASILTEWKSFAPEFIYAVKNRTSLLSMKGDNSPERQLFEHHLFRLKLLDLDLMEKLVDNVDSLSEGGHESVVNEFKEKRLSVIKQIIADISADKIRDPQGIIMEIAKQLGL